MTVSEDINRKKVVCYYTNWAWRRASVGKFLPKDINGELCTHVVYAFATLNTQRLSVDIEDSVDIYNDFLIQAAELRKGSNVKVLLGLGGWNDSKDDKYSRLIGDKSARRKFAYRAAQFVEKHGFDGLDLDWEFPVCWQVKSKHYPLLPQQLRLFRIFLIILSFHSYFSPCAVSVSFDHVTKESVVSLINYCH